jgi:hypothetical protein
MLSDIAGLHCIRTINIVQDFDQVESKAFAVRVCSTCPKLTIGVGWNIANV